MFVDIKTKKGEQSNASPQFHDFRGQGSQMEPSTNRDNLGIQNRAIIPRRNSHMNV